MKKIAVIQKEALRNFFDDCEYDLTVDFDLFWNILDEIVNKHISYIIIKAFNKPIFYKREQLTNGGNVIICDYIKNISFSEVGTMTYAIIDSGSFNNIILQTVV